MWPPVFVLFLEIEVRVIVDVDKLLAGAPNNFVIVDALAKCVEVVEEHKKIMCSISGGGDSDVMLDMLVRRQGQNRLCVFQYWSGVSSNTGTP